MLIDQVRERHAEETDGSIIDAGAAVELVEDRQDLELGVGWMDGQRAGAGVEIGGHL